MIRSCLPAPRSSNAAPAAEATARASGADDILATARIVESLPEAIADFKEALARVRTAEDKLRVLMEEGGWLDVD